MSIWIFLPALALVSGILASIYLLVEWYKHKERLRFPLLWAIALFLMYWFQLPVILNNSGKVVTATNFNLFFAITLPIVWIAIFLVYLGSLSVLGFNLKRSQKTIIAIWFLAALLFFGYNFIINEGVISSYAFPIVGNIVFYLPLHLLIIAAFFRRFFQPLHGKKLIFFFGSLAIVGASVLGIIRNFIILKSVLAYPPQFWYLVLTSQKVFFALQTSSIILLVLGFFLLHHWHYKSVNVQV
ncbi:MAG: hypothetical protein AAB884_00525 [Patescibacteria group bacterium]